MFPTKTDGGANKNTETSTTYTITEEEAAVFLTRTGENRSNFVHANRTATENKGRAMGVESVYVCGVFCHTFSEQPGQQLNRCLWFSQHRKLGLK